MLLGLQMRIKLGRIQNLSEPIIIELLRVQRKMNGSQQCSGISPAK